MKIFHGFALVTACSCALAAAGVAHSAAASPGGAGVADVNMEKISAGIFMMGSFYGSQAHIHAERPIHSVNVNAFHISRYLVTKELWDEVYAWAVAHGYEFDNPGQGKGANHPVHSVTWLDAVKWCNARSERDGLTPAYYTSAGQAPEDVFRAGHANLRTEWVGWDTGYRLPTESEWEKAARGGLTGLSPFRGQFPWGTTIDHSHANYRANGSRFEYDVSPYTTWTYHPSYQSGGIPYTSPVGSFPPNGFGLYDMTGNLWEWCWDRAHGVYTTETVATDPRGPDEHPMRSLRGGSWNDIARSCRVSVRQHAPPNMSSNEWGFRVVIARESLELPAVPESITYPASSSTGRFIVTWDESAEASGYHLERSADNGVTWTQILAGGDTSCAECLDDGSYLYRVRATNAMGHGDWRAGNIACVVVLSALESWRRTQFEDHHDDEDMAGPLADPNDDGIVNLLKFALRGDPHADDGAQILPCMKWNENIGPVFSFRVRGEGAFDGAGGYSVDGITYRVEFADSLDAVQWSPLALTPQNVFPVNTSDGWVLSVPVIGNIEETKIFVRLYIRKQ